MLNEEKKTTTTKEDFILSYFEDWYEHYPRKVAVGAARKAFKKIKLSEVKLVIEKTKVYSLITRKDKIEKTFIPHPATWLSQERWKDEHLNCNEKDKMEEDKMNENKSKNFDVVNKKIEKEKDFFVRDLMKKMVDKMGCDVFFNWFLNAKIESGENVVLFELENQFKRDYVREKFCNIINDILRLYSKKAKIS